MRRNAAVLAAALLAGACSPPKYSRYRSPGGDFSCDVPWGWRVFEERQGGDFSSATFVGPFDPDFFLGAPSLSVRWHALGRPRRLPDGSSESYASPEEFASRTLAEVYGPGSLLEREEVEVSGRRADHFVALSPAPAPAGARFGVAADEAGRLANVRQHAYVVLPAGRGFYVLVYPATRAGYPKCLDRFNRLVNGFRLLKDGPPG